MSLPDVFNRPLQDLRISVIDRCNFRCNYCMPKEQDGQSYTFLKENEWLRFDEVIRLTKLFVRCGVTKVRITGGEPLLRPGLKDLIAKLNRIEGVEDLALTTNGSLLADHAADLKAAGLRRLTVSLDSLDKQVFNDMNGGKGSVHNVLQGIDKADAMGLKDIKINVVVQKGVNDHTVLDLVKYFKKSGHTLRFIEYMDVGNCNHWESAKVVPNAEVLRQISEHYTLTPVKPNYYGEVASRYRFSDRGEVGFISSVTQPFCGSCTRARLSTDGKIFTCLFANRGTDVRGPLRDGASDEELSAMIRAVWSKRADKYSENRRLFQSLKERPPKVEMFQIGG